MFFVSLFLLLFYCSINPSPRQGFPGEICQIIKEFMIVDRPLMNITIYAHFNTYSNETYD